MASLSKTGSTVRQFAREDEDMTQGIEGMLYLDEQQAIPVCYCGRCGGAKYGPSLRCIRCEEVGDDT